MREIPAIADGSAKLKAQSQDDSEATLAPKVFFIKCVQDIITIDSIALGVTLPRFWSFCLEYTVSYLKKREKQFSCYMP